jgi:hypothetical protein
VKVVDEDLNKVRAYVVQSNINYFNYSFFKVNAHCRQSGCCKESVRREKPMRSLTVRKSRS